jgi:hypothetical protein
MADVNRGQYKPERREEYIAQYCFRLPGLASQIEDFVGHYMLLAEGAYERAMKEQAREKAIHTRKLREDSARVLKLLRLNIFREEAQIAESLSMDREHVAKVLTNLSVARKVRRVAMGGRFVYHLVK